tara:strand:- start:1325 stop:1501 length:177 start_codon:yes stop_codon:yes gene_type:complete
MSKNSKNIKCDICNIDIDFHIHQCEKYIGMYYGCKKCDDYCSKCKETYTIKKGKQKNE